MTNTPETPTNPIHQWLDANYKVEGQRLKDRSTNRFITNMDKVISTLQVNFEELSLRAIKEAIPEYIQLRTNDEIQRLDSFTSYDTPEDFIDKVFSSNHLICDTTGDKFTIDGPMGKLPTDRATVETMIVKEMYEYNHSIPKNDKGHPVARSYTKDELIIQLDYYIRSLKLQNVLEIREDLTYNPNVPIDDILTRMLTMMKASGELEVNLTVFKHFLWGLKRHIYGLPVKSELWLAIYGGQNIGKNYFVENVLAPPLRGHVIDTELSSISDIGREIGKFQNRFLINFDELAKGSGQSDDSSDRMSSAGVAQLKAILTRKELTIRQMGGQNQMTLPKNFSCMSTANVHIYDVIDDPTGMRRFFEISLDHPDNTWFNREDILFLEKVCKGIYRGIDENNTEGYLLPNTATWEKVREIQGTYKARSSIDHWLEDGSYELDSGEEFVSCSDLYEDYKDVCKDSGLKAFSKINFIKRLERSFEITKPKNKKHIRAEMRGY
jgi:hypothetical protein